MANPTHWAIRVLALAAACLLGPAVGAQSTVPALEECTVGVASGAATPDGRPLMWKNRDATSRDNVVRAFDDGRFPYVGLCTARSTSSVWGGANAAGFCIMNSVSRDLPGGSERGLGNGGFMKRALRECATVEEFERLLEETNGSGRRTRANFGVLDAVGGAAVFETGHSTYERFDAADAEDGIVVRTNFATTAGGDGGRERYARVCEICHGRDAAEPFDLRFVLRRVVRDLAPPPSALDGGDRRLDVRETLCRQTTVSSMVFHGVAEGEDAAWTTMWTVLGQPLFSVALPSWPVLARTAPEIAGDRDSGRPRSPICDAALGLAAAFFELPLGPDDPGRTDEAPASLRWLRPTGLGAVRGELLAVEDGILDATVDLLGELRGTAPPDDAALATLGGLHDRHAATVLRLLRRLIRTHAADAPVRLLGVVTGLPDGVDDVLVRVNDGSWSSSRARLDLQVPRAGRYEVEVAAVGCRPIRAVLDGDAAVDNTAELGTLSPPRHVRPRESR